MGAVALAEHIKDGSDCDFGQTSADGTFTLDAVYCLGNCACSPAVVVNGKLLGRVTPKRFDDALAKSAAFAMNDHGLRSARLQRRSRWARTTSPRRFGARRRSCGVELRIVRNGSRGLYWLEPMIEVETPAGRVAYGPVPARRCRIVFRAGVPAQRRASTAPRSDRRDPLSEKSGAADVRARRHHRPGFARRLRRAWRLSRARTRARDDRCANRRRSDDLGTARTRRRGLSRRHQMENRARRRGETKIRRVQCRRGRLRHLFRSHDHGRRPAGAHRRDDHRGHRRRRYPGLHLPTLRISRCARHAERGARGGARAAATWARTSAAAAKRFDIEVVVGAGAYICGEETAMLESLEGKRGMVRFKPPLPAIAGLFGQPTIINNVITLASVPIILERGGEFYKNYGMGRSRGTIPIQLAGNVKRPGLIEKAFGVTLRDIIYEYGGGTASGRPVRAVQVGGPLGAYFPESMLDVRARLRGDRGEGRHPWPRRHRGVRRHRQPRAAGALCDGVLRHRIVRQMHAMPHRLDPRRRDRSIGSSRRRGAEKSRASSFCATSATR